MTAESAAHRAYLKQAARQRRHVLFWRAALLVGLFALWECAARMGWIDDFITSSPSRALRAMTTLAKDGALFSHVYATLWETVVGFVLGTVLGTIAAALLWWFPRAAKVLDPYLVVLNALPKIALGPIIIVWVGAGMRAIIVMALFISLIVTILSVYTGFSSVSEGSIRLMRTFGATRGQIFRMVVLPANVPTIISGLKINVGMSWVGVIMGEFLVSKAGLGYLIVYGGQVFNLDLVMGATLVLCVLAGGMYALVALLERRMQKARS